MIIKKETKHNFGKGDSTSSWSASSSSSQIHFVYIHSEDSLCSSCFHKLLYFSLSCLLGNNFSALSLAYMPSLHSNLLLSLNNMVMTFSFTSLHALIFTREVFPWWNRGRFSSHLPYALLYHVKTCNENTIKDVTIDMKNLKNLNLKNSALLIIDYFRD